MGVATKGKRKIIVADKIYRWNVILDNYGFVDYYLTIVSEDKKLILSCPLKTDTIYISKGTIFQNHKTDGCRNCYLLPFCIPEIVTPKIVSDVILWATQGKDAVEIKWNRKEIPV